VNIDEWVIAAKLMINLRIKFMDPKIAP